MVERPGPAEHATPGTPGPEVTPTSSHSRSWKGGCLGASATEARTSAKSLNVPDTSARTWLKAEGEFVGWADFTGQEATGRLYLCGRRARYP
ncbi:hypothetical protein ACH4ZU_08420 [Streptomyces sp. NPDC020472]|uniref:hypothetical protein n=1 Tax=Streptomyces sp. NPDC020472 TaxID=3365075 RepID=UPI0037AE4FDE